MHFQNSRYFEYGIERADGSCQTITTADLHRMRSADVLDLTSIVHHISETKLEVKCHYLSLRVFINSIVHDFGYVDVELYSQFSGAPHLPNENVTFEGVGDISKGYSMTPIRALAYEEDQPEEGKSTLLLCFRLEEKHLYSSNFLRNIVATLEDDDKMDAADRTSLLNELKWFLAVRKHWKSLLRFIDEP